MCRKCGEPDRRGSAEDRRRRRAYLLDLHGNGTICPCQWCGVLLGAEAGTLAIAAGVELVIVKLEQDRLIQGGPYARWNLVPACGPCNRARTTEAGKGGDECEYGAVGTWAA